MSINHPKPKPSFNLAARACVANRIQDLGFGEWDLGYRMEGDTAKGSLAH